MPQRLAGRQVALPLPLSGEPGIAPPPRGSVAGAGRSVRVRLYNGAVHALPASWPVLHPPADAADIAHLLLRGGAGGWVEGVWFGAGPAVADRDFAAYPGRLGRAAPGSSVYLWQRPVGHECGEMEWPRATVLGAERGAPRAPRAKRRQRGRR